MAKKAKKGSSPFKQKFKLAAKYVGLTLLVQIFLGVSILYIADSAGGGIHEGHAWKKVSVPRGMVIAVANYVGEFHGWDLIKVDIPTMFKKMTRVTKPQPHKPVVIMQSHTPMPATLLLEGFLLRYHDAPHRMTWTEARVDGISNKPGGPQGMAAVAFEGGDWSRVDGIKFRVDALPVSSPKMRFTHLADTLHLTGGRAQKRVRLDLTGLGIDEFTKQAIVLRGFSFDSSKDHKDGLNTKGLTVRIEPRGRDRNFLVFDIIMEMKGGPVAFRPDPGYDYKTDGHIFYTVISADNAAFPEENIHYMLRNRERAPADVQSLMLKCAASGYANAVPALRGFEFDIHSTKARFIRELTLQLKDNTFNSLTGRLVTHVDGYVSNAGTTEGALDVRFNADVVGICVPPGTKTGTPLAAADDLFAVSENKAYPLKPVK